MISISYLGYSFDKDIIDAIGHKYPIFIASKITKSDASKRGIRFVVYYKYPKNALRLIGCGSNKLYTSDKGYFTIEKEALRIVFGVQKFNKILYDTKFVLKTNQKSLFREFKKTSVGYYSHSAQERWTVSDSTYDFEVEYKPERTNQVADSLSMWPFSLTDLTGEEQIDRATDAIVDHRTQRHHYILGIFQKGHGEDWTMILQGFMIDHIEINRVNSPSSIVLINLLRQHFSRFWVAHSLVSDNGPCFINKEMKFCSAENQIKHIRTTPYQSRCSDAVLITCDSPFIGKLMNQSLVKSYTMKDVQESKIWRAKTADHLKIREVNEQMMNLKKNIRNNSIKRLLRYFSNPS
ncbi:hypothetical protein RF11_10779 [Thelohanellus kitauei]|uniref:Reverse transcriptase RNase H-like domain-containing protein n=1 Tax=Thelohanellus kitauei TaxID=669202 RepID=A0A0C2N3D8_THEKT|nr:hypothetical protein RF11_10779 [Thelohanellus kitauei]